MKFGDFLSVRSARGINLVFFSKLSSKCMSGTIYILMNIFQTYHICAVTVDSMYCQNVHDISLLFIWYLYNVYYTDVYVCTVHNPIYIIMCLDVAPLMLVLSNKTHTGWWFYPK